MYNLRLVVSRTRASTLLLRWVRDNIDEINSANVQVDINIVDKDHKEDKATLKEYRITQLPSMMVPRNGSVNRWRIVPGRGNIISFISARIKEYAATAANDNAGNNDNRVTIREEENDIHDIESYLAREVRKKEQEGDDDDDDEEVLTTDKIRKLHMQKENERNQALTSYKGYVSTDTSGAITSKNKPRANAHYDSNVGLSPVDHASTMKDGGTADIDEDELRAWMMGKG